MGSISRIISDNTGYIFSSTSCLHSLSNVSSCPAVLARGAATSNPSCVRLRTAGRVPAGLLLPGVLWWHMECCQRGYKRHHGMRTLHYLDVAAAVQEYAGITSGHSCLSIDLLITGCYLPRGDARLIPRHFVGKGVYSHTATHDTRLVRHDVTIAELLLLSLRSSHTST
jgi:hypothetical protein